MAKQGLNAPHHGVMARRLARRADITINGNKRERTTCARIRCALSAIGAAVSSRHASLTISSRMKVTPCCFGIGPTGKRYVNPVTGATSNDRGEPRLWVVAVQADATRRPTRLTVTQGGVKVRSEGDT